ncbi:hypothetical protein BC751_0016 [Cecembia calidifontis]|uniref:Uncharacterized protein n=1 Tax=Cecembia calidifontis TaxID=1187080 RepID=A0A4V2F5Z3_9BACT|nr:hypothetical protein BC751_0016 [Cecembia calidifontis]
MIESLFEIKVCLITKKKPKASKYKKNAVNRTAF